MIDITKLSTEQKDKIISIFIHYCNEQKISCSDAVMQIDNAYLAAPEAMSEMAEVIENLIQLEQIPFRGKWQL